MYNGLRGDETWLSTYGCTGVPAWERRALEVAYPLLARAIDRYLDVTPAAAARSEAEVRAIFDAVGKRLDDGRPYLCGERFSAADLTFAALAAAVLMPPEYGVPLPQPDELPAPIAAVVRELRAHPAGAHALAMFRDRAALTARAACPAAKHPPSLALSRRGRRGPGTARSSRPRSRCCPRDGREAP